MEKISFFDVGLNPENPCGTSVFGGGASLKQ